MNQKTYRTSIFSETGTAFVRFELCSDFSSPAQTSLNGTESPGLSEIQLLSVPPPSGCNMSRVGASSHTVKCDRLRAVSSTSGDSWGWHWEVMSREKDSCKGGEAVTQLDSSSVLRRSGDGSDSQGSVWVSDSSGVGTLRSTLPGCPS